LDLVNAGTAYQKSKLELQRATGTTLEENKIQIQKRGGTARTLRREFLPRTPSQANTRDAATEARDRQRTRPRACG